MNILIVGLGVQGIKRKKILRNTRILTVDIKNKDADYQNIRDVPIKSYDVVFLCVPDKEKFSLLKFCIENKKHVLVEKPLWFRNIYQYIFLEKLAIKNKVLCYIAYNHRFEPHFVRMKKVIRSKVLEKFIHVEYFTEMEPQG